MKKTIFTIALFTGFSFSIFAQTARVQVIHNSADAAASTVDVWLDNTLLIDDFAFRTASPFINAPAGVQINIGIAPSNSTSATDAIANFPLTLVSGETYVVVANGIVSPTGYTPATPFDLSIYAMGQEVANQAGDTDVLVFHGCTDAPTVDVIERAVPAGRIVDDLSYGQFTSYLELPTVDFTLDVRTSNSLTTVASYSAPLATLGTAGNALVVLASGFLNPANNSNGPAFGLYVALPSGGPLLALPSVTASTGSAKIQVIHNSADAAAATVDVYIDGSLEFDNFAFRTATPFVSLPSFVSTEIAIAPSNSTSVLDAIATFPYVLSDDFKYVIVANGIVSPTGYSPATPFNLYVADYGRTAASQTNNTDVLVFHGCTDAPTVDVRLPNNTVLVNDINYGEYNGSYLELPNANYVINVTDATGATVVQSYDAPLQTLGLQNQALVVLASGFLNPTVNSNGAGFGLWAALSAGGNLVQLPIHSNTGINDLQASSFAIYPNPASNSLTIKMDNGLGNTKLTITDVLGKTVYTGYINASINTVDVSNFDNGVYSLTLSNDKIYKSHTFVKK
jgi:hypothetical protein